MQPNLKGIRGVDDIPYGIYVWKMPDGRYVGDDDGNWMNIVAKKGDPKRIAQLTEAARYYGVTEGSPLFLSGNRRINDEEHDEQRKRLEWGLVPDPHDIGSNLDDLRNGTL